MAVIYFSFFTIYDGSKTIKTNTTPLKTTKGTIYLPELKTQSIENTIKYIEQYTAPEQKILVLPEGMAFNFLTNRGIDYKLPMADRLYYDAIGSEKIIKSIKDNDYEIILIAKGYGLTNFGRPYLYDDDNEVVKYIQKHYVLDWETKYKDNAKSKEYNIMKCYVKPY